MLDKKILDKTKKYLVGVSGGMDSMALLDMLVKRGYDIEAVHVNYHFRDDSDEDENVVKEYCFRHHIPLFVREVEKKEYEKGNFEMQARKIRYQFYKEIGLKENIDTVILAHHFNDHVETIIMQMQRHNTMGYLGIKENSFVEGMHILRPLLKVKKEDLYHYCMDHDIKYHDDYTNDDISYTRNRIRHKDIHHYDLDDLLEKASIHNKNYLKKMVRLEKVLSLYDKQGYLSLNDIDKDDLKDLIYQMVKKEVYPPLISRFLIDEIEKQLKSKKPNIEMNLPVNHVFIKEYDNIRVGKKETYKTYCAIYDKLSYEKTQYFTIAKQGHLNEGVYLSEDDFPVTIRCYQPGDIIHTSGGTKKVSRLFIDRKVPMEKRKVWPIVLNRRQEIILIPHIAKNIKYLYTKPNIFVVK